MFSTPRSAPSTSPPASWSSSISTSTSQQGQSMKLSLKIGEKWLMNVMFFCILYKKRHSKKKIQKNTRSDMKIQKCSVFKYISIQLFKYSSIQIFKYYQVWDQEILSDLKTWEEADFIGYRTNVCWCWIMGLLKSVGYWRMFSICGIAWCYVWVKWTLF